jgi:hypothetical protein
LYRKEILTNERVPALPAWSLTSNLNWWMLEKEGLETKRSNSQYELSLFVVCIKILNINTLVIKVPFRRFH